MDDAIERNDGINKSLQAAELEQARLTNEKIKVELVELRRARTHPILAQLVPVITTLVAVAGFLWGVAQYVGEQKKAQETAEREYMKPWLESQREIYLQALSFAATVANSNNNKKREEAADGFWQLYQGKMILVETKSVSEAMISFGYCLEIAGSCDKNEMNSRLRVLATAMAGSMAATAKMTFKEFSANQFKYTSKQ